MMRVGFKRPPGYATLGQKYLREIKTTLTSKLVTGLREVQDAILETPVYTGNTLVNYRWSIGSPITGTRAPVKDPLLPGKTSEMALGREPRRRANATIVREEFAEILTSLKSSGNPFQRIYLTNNTPYFTEVEYGTYSTSEGHATRTPPGGMTRRGETLLAAALSEFIRKV